MMGFLMTTAIKLSYNNNWRNFKILLTPKQKVIENFKLAQHTPPNYFWLWLTLGTKNISDVVFFFKRPSLNLGPTWNYV